MTQILHLISSLDYSGAARQLTWLADLPKDICTQRVVVLGDAAPWTEQLRSKGITVDHLEWRSPFDVRPLFALRSLLDRSRANLVHAWSLGGVRALTSTRHPWERTIASHVLPAMGKLGMVDRWLLRKVGRVLAYSDSQRRRLEEIGVDSSRINRLTPGIPREWVESAGSTEKPSLLDRLPSDRRVVIGVGPLTSAKGFFDAVSSLDMLRYVHNDVHLVLIGRGPERSRIESIATGIRVRDRVHFDENCVDVRAYLRCAEALWAPSRGETGTMSLLEAMAFGVPVLCSNQPCFQEIVDHERTAMFFSTGDKMGLAKHTRVLLEDEQLAGNLSRNGREQVEQNHDHAKLLERYGRLLAEG